MRDDAPMSSPAITTTTRPVPNGVSPSVACKSTTRRTSSAPASSRTGAARLGRTAIRRSTPTRRSGGLIGAERSSIAADAIWDRLMQAVILISLGTLVYVLLVSRLLRPMLDAVGEARWVLVVERPSMLWAAMGVVLLTLRTVLWFRYRPAPAATMEDAPRLTVIIPAYNEGAMVAKSIDSVAAARYPAGRLEVFVVDDGSTDDTWEHIQRAAARHPGVVTTLRFTENRGKRAGLAAGFERARGEIVVTIDSDSVIEEGALLAMVGAFRDPKVGAVAGKVLVYNRREGIIPQMLHVRFILAFDLLRAVQSTYRTVYCVPGALAGYRTSVVREVLGAWINQTFLGVRCTYGEDRALTNYILSAGYDSLYQRTAVVHTIVPTTYARLCKMLLRWDRSYVREEIRFARLVWRRPLLPRLMSILDSIVTNLRYPIGYASLALLVALTLTTPLTLVRVMIAIGSMSFLNMLYFLRTERSWSFVYGILYAYLGFFGLFWIFPYAVLTVRSRSWLTR
jgi:hyaluronan synthase